MTIIKFDCYSCREKEKQRLLEIDKKENEGKRFYQKTKEKIDPKTYRVEATELVIVSKYPKLDEYDSSEEHPKSINYLQMKCSVCEKITSNYINVGLTDLWYKINT